MGTYKVIIETETKIEKRILNKDSLDRYFDGFVDYYSIGAGVDNLLEEWLNFKNSKPFIDILLHTKGCFKTITIEKIEKITEEFSNQQAAEILTKSLVRDEDFLFASQENIGNTIEYYLKSKEIRRVNDYEASYEIIKDFLLNKKPNFIWAKFSNII